jgi:hypothetical protein
MFEMAAARRQYNRSIQAGGGGASCQQRLAVGLMAVGAILASASAINSDYFGAAKLPVMLSEHGEIPPLFQRRLANKPVVSLVTIGALALSCERTRSTRAFSGDKRRISHRVRGGQSSGREACSGNRKSPLDIVARRRTV